MQENIKLSDMQKVSDTGRKIVSDYPILDAGKYQTIGYRMQEVSDHRIPDAENRILNVKLNRIIRQYKYR
jgi:hypothetical protein